MEEAPNPGQLDGVELLVHLAKTGQIDPWNLDIVQVADEYLKAVADAYIDFFYNYDQSPLLIVNTTDFDLANNGRNFEILLKYIQDLSPGRHYFNPREL